MGWVDYAKAVRACEKRARAEHLSGKAKAPRQWWVWLYNYAPGNPDRRVKGLSGPFLDRAEAEEQRRMREREGSWYPRIMSREPTAAELRGKSSERRRNKRRRG